MNVISRILSSAAILASLAAGLSARGDALDPKVAEEYRLRGGLPNVLAKLEAGGRVNIAYLGGSITEARDGWRSQTLEWFRGRFPKADVREINAAISGTGAGYGAIRLAGDVLRGRPDLLFVEFKVNGSDGFDYESVEGIVRQTWAADPGTDICFVYTCGEWMLPELRERRHSAFCTAMEDVCNRYGIPSIELGLEVVRRIDAGKMAFRAGSAAAGQMVFARDACHPTTEGHAIYRDVIARGVEAMLAAGAKPGPHEVPAEPLRPNPFVEGQLVAPERFLSAPDWHPVDFASDPVYRSDFGRTKAMLRGGMWTDREGASFTLKFTGTTVGLSDIPQDREMTVEASVDGGAPIAFTRLRTKEPLLHSRFYFLPALPRGEHTVTFTVKSVPAGQRFFCGQALVAGAVPSWRPKARWRGVNLLGMFKWQPPGQGSDSRCPGFFREEDFALLEEFGFNYARLPLDYRFWIKGGDWDAIDEEAVKRVDEAVAFGRRHGIHVTVCFHRAPGWCINRPAEPRDLFTDPEAQRVCAKHWAFFARRYRGIPNDELSFDLFNEPCEPANGDAVMQLLVDAIRAEDPERFVFADGYRCGRVPVKALYGRYNVAQSMHTYDPFGLTHYGASWTNSGKPILKWPMDGVADGVKWLEDNVYGAWDGTTAAGEFWHVGEFGAYIKTPHATVLAWMEDNLKVLKRRGIGFALWNLDGAFGFIDSGRADVEYEDFRGRKLDRRMLELLRRY